MQRKSTTRFAVPLAAGAALTLALAGGPSASAGAVKAQNGHYAQSKNNVIVATFDVSGGQIKKFSHNDMCTRYPLEFPPISFAKGRFKFSGAAVKDLNSQEWTVRLSGKSVSRTVIAGTATYEKTKGNAPCKTTTKFKVKRTGKARG